MTSEVFVRCGLGNKLYNLTPMGYLCSTKIIRLSFTASKVSIAQSISLGLMAFNCNNQSSGLPTSKALFGKLKFPSLS
jgi:hypothetical protein